MKPTHRGFASIATVVLAALTVLGSGAYFSSDPTTDLNTAAVVAETSATTEIAIVYDKFVFQDSVGARFDLQLGVNNTAHLKATGKQMYRKLNLTYTSDGTMSHFYFDSYDTADENANGLETLNNLFVQGDSVFILEEQEDSTHKITWTNPDMWLNNAEVDKDVSFFIKL